MGAAAQRVEMIPIADIVILNPRARNRQIFNEIVESIARAGLKRPITVTRQPSDGGPLYHLVCGQGRLEACRMLGHDRIPALVVSGDEQDCLLSSIIENCARRQQRPLDLLRAIGDMRRGGIAVGEIARRTGLSSGYVAGVAHLLELGEERLLHAAARGSIPMSIAVDIAKAIDGDMENALIAAFEDRRLTGRQVIAARRLIADRRRWGKAIAAKRSAVRPRSSQSLIRAYEEDIRRKRDLVRRCEMTRARLSFVVEAIRTLIDDEGFLAILEQEVLLTLPMSLASRIPDVRGARG